MKASRFSEEQIIAILKEQEAGVPTVEVCRRHGVSSATFYKWKAKFGGLEVSEAKRLRQLEDENAKLKRLLAESMLDVSTLREMLGKTSNAQFEEKRRELGDRDQRLFATPGLWPGGH